MKNTYLSVMKLPSISELQQKRISSIDSLINNLKFHDVEKDETFEVSKQKIKKAILFEPITLLEPEFVDHSYVERNVTFEQQIIGLSKHQYFHKIKFPFTGDKELFLHSYNGMTYFSSDHGVMEPNGNTFTVYVELPKLNPPTSIEQARSLLRLTTDIGQNNSNSIIIWNTAIEKRIDSDLENKRAELFDIFDK